MPTFEDLDSLAREQSIARFPGAIGLVDDLLDTINGGMSSGGGTHDRGAILLTALLINRASNSLYRAREDALCGFYGQAWTMCRAALEDWGTINYVRQNPADSNIWLRDILPEAHGEARRAPSFADIWKTLGPLTAVAQDLYGVLSAGGAHPRPEGMGFQFQIIGSTTVIRVGGVFDQDDLKVTLSHLIALATLILGEVGNIRGAGFPGTVDPGWNEEVGKLVARVGEFSKAFRAGQVS